MENVEILVRQSAYRISLNSMRVHYYFPTALGVPTIQGGTLFFALLYLPQGDTLLSRVPSNCTYYSRVHIIHGGILFEEIRYVSFGLAFKY